MPQGIEAITNLLMDLGIYGVEIIDQAEMAEFFAKDSPHWDYIDEAMLSQVRASEAEASIIFYIGTDRESSDLLKRVNEELSRLKACPQSAPLGSLALQAEAVNDQDWLHEWKKHFEPIRIGRVLIVPEWDDNAHPEDEIVFTIDPGSAFGTGQHATTMLCIESLQDRVRLGSSVLDIGCGSGILSIISLLLGAGQATACDIDPSAVEVTKKNAKINPIDQSSLRAFAGDILSSPELLKNISQGKFDIIIANIVADVIKGLAPLVKNLLAPDGVFIASGIIEERLSDVLLSLSANKLNVVETKTADGWCCVVANG